MLSLAVRNPFWPLVVVAGFRSAYYLIVYEVLGEKAKADFGALFALLAIQGIQGMCLGGVGLALQGSLRDKNFWRYQILGIGNLLTAALPVSAYWLALPFKVVQVFSVPLISIVQAVWARIRQHYSLVGVTSESS